MTGDRKRIVLDVAVDVDFASNMTEAQVDMALFAAGKLQAAVKDAACAGMPLMAMVKLVQATFDACGAAALLDACLQAQPVALTPCVAPKPCGCGACTLTATVTVRCKACGNLQPQGLDACSRCGGSSLLWARRATDVPR